jgi:hypothetical protein
MHQLYASHGARLRQQFLEILHFLFRSPLPCSKRSVASSIARASTSSPNALELICSHFGVLSGKLESPKVGAWDIAS